MPVSFVGAGAWDHNNVCSPPGGLSAADLLIASVNGPWVLPAGWAWLVGGAGQTFGVAYKFTNGSEGAVGFGGDPGGNSATGGRIIAVRGAKQPSPFRTSSVASVTPNPSINSKPDELVVWLWLGQVYSLSDVTITSAIATAAGLTGWTKRAGNVGFVDGVDGNWQAGDSIYTGKVAAEGATGLVPWTRTMSSNRYEQGVLVSIESAPLGRPDAFANGINYGFNGGLR